MTEDWIETLKSCIARLTNELDPDTGLFPLLVSEGVLTSRQVDQSKAKSTPHERVEEVINLLTRRKAEHYENFRQILSSATIGRDDLVRKYLPEFKEPRQKSKASKRKSSGQASAKVVSSDDEEEEEPPAKTKRPKEQPQQKKQEVVPTTWTEALKGKKKSILGKLRFSNGLLVLLDDKEVIDSDERRSIEAEKTEKDKCMKLLDILEKLDDELLRPFLEILVEDGQRHVVDIIVGYKTKKTEFV